MEREIRFAKDGDEAPPLVIKESVAKRFAYFQQVLDGEFQEGTATEVVIAGVVSREIASVVLQKKAGGHYEATASDWFDDRRFCKSLLDAFSRCPTLARFITDHDDMQWRLALMVPLHPAPIKQQWQRQS
ncbi:unnamed protein product [Vitrella brassicaformis CCMP3155]|uniref:Uncharacterized protein n=1 Tax=Vitrella brassicaformis (strain CCMP3155) TaxID=1169540 RepID=A0A0G4EHI7_VITBC|nr:unnamed protein product [Vitrella brassicaformis CCMP3155]|eukprot:CEL95957.1 unnamed protein product [Vitrella brassicaformis CCMP3155]